MRLRLFILATFLAVVVAACSPPASPPVADTASAPPVVQTVSGPVEGFYKSEAATFLGIPFAAPPVGPLRWRPPESPKPWTSTLDAKTFGPTCAQIYELGVFAGPANSNEDCLYLNVFAPKDALKDGSKLPVIVWIYGGGYVDGESDDYDGSKLAVRGGAVVVTFNYRLNLFGFLAHPALDKEGHAFGNYAFLDQQFALRWVKDNITKFGGDPNNVTLGGQSAGGSSVGAQLTSPLAEGLFHKAIISSSGSYLSAAPLETAQKMGVGFAKAAGCGEGADAATAECLRKLPADAVVKLAGTAKGNSAFVHSRAIQDGQIVPDGAAPLFAAGKFQKMPTMLGTVRDEGNFFIAVQLYLADAGSKKVGENDFANYVRNFVGEARPGAKAIIQGITDRYSTNSYPTLEARYGAVQSDIFVCRAHLATHLLADQTPLYVYEFRDRTAPSYFPAVAGFDPQAMHTSEIQFLFPGYHGGNEGIPRTLNAEQEKLSDQLVTAWGNFARTGNPNGEGDQPWPPYTKASPLYAAQDLAGISQMAQAEFWSAHQCDLWQKMLEDSLKPAK